MSWVVEELASVRGVELCRGKIKADTVVMVAREDASTADSTSGRGVTTSRETVAKRLGMSGRHVGTARRILEELGASITIVRGRQLSPQERSLARKAHGGYQEAAGSVRALTMPPFTAEAHTGAPDGAESVANIEPVDTFHLPRRGSVNKTPPVKKYSPTSVKPLVKAAARPNLKRKTHPKPDRTPRALETQRFVWAIAQRFLLSDVSSPRPGAPLRPGALRGGRHIGHLARILEQNRVTPHRYTPQSLADALQRLIQNRKLRSPRYDDIRDPLAHFAWMLGRLNELTEGETTIERIRRENEERAQRQRDLLSTPSIVDQAEADAAAQAFFAEFRRHRRPDVRGRRVDIVELVRAIIGTTAPLHATPRAVQELVGATTRLHNALIADSWTLSTNIHGRLIWTAPDGAELVLDVHSEADTIQLSTTPPVGLPDKFDELLSAVV